MSDDEILETRAEILAYLDEAIDNWRELRDGPDIDRVTLGFSSRDCVCYVDAFQSVRTSIFGETKP